MHMTRVTVPAIDPLASIGPTRPAAGLWPAWLEAVLERRTERQQLLAMEERDLRDIGLTPSEAIALAQEPLWHR